MYESNELDIHVTASVINATGPNASPRIREVIANLTRHLHDFCRESKITRSEFDAALKMVGDLSIFQTVEESLR